MSGTGAVSAGRALSVSTLGMVLVAFFLVGPGRAVGNTTPLPGLSLDLAIAMDVGSNPVQTQTEVQLESRIENRGTAVTGPTRAVFEIPASVVAGDGAFEHCTVVGSTQLERGQTAAEEPWTVICELGTLAPGSAVNLTFSVIGGSPGTHVISVQVGSDGDATPADNHAEYLLHVLPDGPAVLPAFQELGPTNPLHRSSA